MDHTHADASERPRFARLLQAYREAASMTRVDLAGASGVDRSHITRLEQGRRGPSASVCLRLAEAIDLGRHVADDLLIAAGFLPSKAGVVALALRYRYEEPSLDEPTLLSHYSAIMEQSRSPG